MSSMCCFHAEDITGWQLFLGSLYPEIGISEVALREILAKGSMD